MMPESLESMITPHPPPMGLLLVEGVYDCTPDHRDELSFKEGEIIVVTKKVSKDWWVSDNSWLVVQPGFQLG